MELADLSDLAEGAAPLTGEPGQRPATDLVRIEFWLGPRLNEVVQRQEDPRGWSGVGTTGRSRSRWCGPIGCQQGRGSTARTPPRRRSARTPQFAIRGLHTGEDEADSAEVVLGVDVLKREVEDMYALLADRALQTASRAPRASRVGRLILVLVQQLGPKVVLQQTDDLTDRQ